jgi:ankyrin repeat protein
MLKLLRKLRRAAYAGDVQSVADAICSDTNIINVANDGRWYEDRWQWLSALMLASREGHTDVVELLLKHGVDVDQRLQLAHGAEPDNQTALFFASRKYPRVVKLLLEYGADTNLSDWQGNTPLLVAAQKGELEIARLLLEHGADVNAKNKNEWAAVPDWRGITPLLFAAKRGELEIARLLLDHGADVNARNDNGVSALMFAAHSNHLETVKLLLTHSGIDVNQKNKKEDTALDVAKGRETKSLLVKAGAKRGEDSDLQ